MKIKKIFRFFAKEFAWSENVSSGFAKEFAWSENVSSRPPVFARGCPKTTKVVMLNSFQHLVPSGPRPRNKFGVTEKYFLDSLVAIPDFVVS